MVSTEEGSAGLPVPERPADGLSSTPRLANRYGTPKPGLGRRTKAVLASVAGLAAVVVVALMAVPSGSGSITPKDVGFSIPDASTAVVDFNVTKPSDATVECAVQVLNDSYAVVGWKTVRIGPAETETVSQRISLRTDSLGVTGGVNACWLVEDAQL